MNSNIPVITVDGPGGSGKGTLSHLLAKELGWHFLDSGALYRVLAFAAQRHGVALDAEEALVILAEHLRVQCLEPHGPGGETRIILEGDDVTHAIRTEECGNAASKIAAFPLVRTALLERQRVFRQAPGLIADGRDMGLVIFPDAILKLFLLASAEERALRRYHQLKQKGINVSLCEIQAEMLERDHRDKTRLTAPLMPAKDALLVDTNGQSIQEIFRQVMSAVQVVMGRHAV